MESTTTPEVAKKIMGSNFISIQETATLFPIREEDLPRYDPIPFSQALLYYCSEEDNPFALVPGISYLGRITYPLTILGMKKNFLQDWPKIFAPCGSLDNPTSNSFVNYPVCLPRWYLMPKKALDEETIRRIVKKVANVDPKPWVEEQAVVYIYTWLLFFFLRQEAIFTQIPFVTSSLYKPVHRFRVGLEFRNGRITIYDRDINKSHGIVPSIKPHPK